MLSLNFTIGSTPDRAASFAAEAHAAVGQRRKYVGTPYIEHPLAVARLVMSVTNDEATIAAALLHDTVEDTNVTLDGIAREFGAEIAMLVENLTDVSRPEDGSRRVRKEIDLRHTARADPRAKTVKLADLIHNSKSIVKHDPKFARVYLAEKARLLEVLHEGHPALYALAVDSLRRGQEAMQQHSGDAC